jgi:hypothetical protein
MILVVEVDDFSNTRLDNELGTFVTGKEIDVERSTSYIGENRIQDCILFGMDHIRILGMQRRDARAVAGPRQAIVRTSKRKAVVAQTHNTPIQNKTSPDLCGRILGFGVGSVSSEGETRLVHRWLPVVNLHRFAVKNATHIK